MRPTCTTRAWSRSPGPGAPWVAEFAPVDLAAALGITHDAARQLIADALELDYRLPKLWKRVLAGEVPVWRARLIARETTDLSVKAALFADQLIAATPRRIGHVKAAQLVQEARLYFDPDRAIADEAAALTKRGVWLRHNSAPATTDVVMTLDTPDALLFEQTVTRIAGDLRELGDSDDLDARRARAVGILADPQFALDLLSGREAAASGNSTAAPRTSTCTSPPQTWPQTSPTAPVPPRSRSSARPPPSCSPTGSPGSQQPAPRSPSARSSTSTPTEPWTSTTHPHDARDRPAPRRPLRLPKLPPRLPSLRPRPHHRIRPRSRTADHPARPTPETSHPSVAPTTASRPTPLGTTNASTTAVMSGPRPPGTSTPSPPPPPHLPASRLTILGLV